MLERPDPKYRELQTIYVRLKDLQINDYDPKSKLPFHGILGISGDTKIKLQEWSSVDLPGEPIVELTKLWVGCCLSWRKTGVTNLFFSKISLLDYENFFN